MSKKNYRVAFVRFAQESNSFSTVQSTLKDFTHDVEGQELLDRCTKKRKWEIEGYLRNLELSGFMRAVKQYENIEPVPLFSTAAITGGPLKKEAYLKICTRLREMLEEAGELDGIYFALHGALDVVGVREPDADFVKIAREVLGKKVVIAVSFDCHAILTKPKVECADIICTYKTNPHRDYARTGHQTGDLLIQKILGKIKLNTAWRSIPMILGGGTGVDFLAPMASVFRRMRRMEKIPGVLSASIYMCHPFLSHPDTGWGVHVITDNNQELAEILADELSERCWKARAHRYSDFVEVDDVINKAKKSVVARKTGTITLCDASDVVGAGGTGENTNLLRKLLTDAKPLTCYVPIRDPHAIEELWGQDLGAEIEMAIGGKLQPEFNETVFVKGSLFTKKETDAFGRIAVLDLGHVKLVITEGFAFALKPAFYRDLGLNAWAPDITVVKSFFHFRLYYLFISRKSYYVRTSGITDIDIILTVKTTDPVYPNVDLATWREVDWKRRNVAKKDRKIYFEWGIDTPKRPRAERRKNRKALRLQKRNENSTGLVAEQ
ncbi:MAG: M81 family metallopeptidase [Aureispira sp.]|nr:M81 family metallopeptidase [Aureispira sp.]